MYRYYGFGLNILSAIEMPELIFSDFEHEDVTITYGKVPEQLEGGTIRKSLSDITENEYILRIKNTCSYYAGFGKTVIIEPAEGTEERSIRLFLLGTVMAAIVYQRGLIPLHASAIVKGGKLMLFTGHSGAGKSTLVANLATRGYEVFTDDICVVNYDKATNQVRGMASYPMIKLWEDALNKIDNDTFNRDFKIRPQLEKYGQFFHDSFLTESLPVDKVFILQPGNEVAEILNEPLTTMQAFKQIERQAYRYRFTTAANLRPVHFSLMTALAKQASTVVLKRPFVGTSVQSFADMVEELL